MGQFNKIAVILAVGAAIWFFIAFVDLIEAYTTWADVPEGISRSDFRLSGYVYSLLDSLFMLGSAVMVEFLDRISRSLRLGSGGTKSK